MKTSSINSDFMDIPALVRLGVHYGHKATLLRSVMRPYVLGNWHGINVLNVDRTLTALETGLNIVFEAICANTQTLFLCNGLSYPRSVASALANVGQYCVTSEFGGIVSNWFTFKEVGTRIARYRKITSVIKDKRLIAYYNRRVARAVKPFVSEPSLKGLPGAVVLFCSLGMDRVIAEANKTKVPIIGLADTLSKVSGIDCVVPICEGSNKIGMFICKLFASVCSKAVLVADRARLLGIIIDSDYMLINDCNTSQALSVICCHFKSAYLVSNNVKVATELARLVNVLDVGLTFSLLLSLISIGFITFNTSIRSVINLCKYRLLTAKLAAMAITRLRLFVKWLECVRCLVCLKPKAVSNAITTVYGKFGTPNVKVEHYIPKSVCVMDLDADYRDIKYSNFNITSTFNYFFNLSK
ncbi:MAG: 30S ribosomal protein S2 [Candidatus Hodgkinia cicadicola]